MIIKIPSFLFLRKMHLVLRKGHTLILITRKFLRFFFARWEIVKEDSPLRMQEYKHDIRNSYCFIYSILQNTRNNVD